MPDTSDSKYNVFLNTNHFHFAKENGIKEEVTDQEKRKRLVVSILFSPEE